MVIGTLKIFIVEDEKILRISLADDLRDAGYNVQEFDDPIKALEAIQTEPPDLVITDIKMPQMDGLALLSKTKYYNPDTDVIIMTAYASEESKLEAIKKGAFKYIKKPFQNNEILQLLEQIKKPRSLKR
jgi:DNA-binding NtrC family response regulator